MTDTDHAQAATGRRSLNRIVRRARVAIFGLQLIIVEFACPEIKVVCGQLLTRKMLSPQWIVVQTV